MIWIILTVPTRIKDQTQSNEFEISNHITCPDNTQLIARNSIEPINT